jgi:oligoribonuclease NrnB/cAMP/cGMP phosphodiesterase (DHH superfamily)
MKNLKDIVVIYHDQCRDGFGSAYSAWKKFGDEASYIPRKTQDSVPENLKDKEIYILDYSFKKPELDKLVAENIKVVVIDHHESAKEAVTAFPQNIFDNDHSAAVLSWQYFHPNTPVPTLLKYVEDHDLWHLTMPHTREFGAALGEYLQDFETWDQLARNMEEADSFSSFISHGGLIAGFEDKLVDKILQFREKIIFGGHEIYAINAERIYRSILGNKLATLNGEAGGVEMSIVYYRYDGMVHCSLRSKGDVDVSAIAQKYGGGGHKNAASIRVKNFSDLPFEFK